MPFSYFGSKARLVNLYHKPGYDKIIEPFAGAANYAYKYYDREVHINDADQRIYLIWKWIQQASKQDIIDLPDPKLGTKISEIKDLCDGQRLLLTLLCGRSSKAFARDVVTAYAAGYRKKPRPGDRKTKDPSVFELTKIKLLKIAGKIKHWKITNLDYHQIENEEATWFIDPPYQTQGKSYTFNNSMIDFDKLGKWCLSRKGEIIVCEAAPANWLPFVPLQHKKLTPASSKKKYQELVFLKSNKKVGLERLL